MLSQWLLQVSQAMAYRVAGADVPEEADETVVLMQKKLQQEMSKTELPAVVPPTPYDNLSAEG